MKLRAPSSAPKAPDAVVDVPIGELPLLYHEAVVIDGYIAADSEHDAKLRRSDEVLDFSPGKFRIFKRSAQENGEFIVPPGRLTEPPVDNEYNGYFLGIEKNGDPYSIIIPSVEILRFFYATSDRITKLLFNGGILDPHSNIFYKESIDENGIASLTLRKNMKDSDARYLARFAFSDYALKQAQNIYALWAVRKAKKQHAIISAIPPIQGEARTEFLYRQIETPHGIRKLITRILRCHCPPPYTELSFSRENDGTPADDDIERPESTFPPGGSVEPPEDNSPEALADSPPSVGNANSEIRDPEIDERFPEFQKPVVEKVRRELTETRYNHKKTKLISTSISTGSVVDDTADGPPVGKTHISGDLIPGDANDVSDDKEPELTDAIDETPRQGHSAVIQKLDWMRLYTPASISYRTVFSSMAVFEDVPVNVFPKKIDGKSKTWLFTDEAKKKRRFAIIAEVKFLGRTRYVLELQQVIGKPQYSTLIFWNDSEDFISTGEIAKLLLSCAREGKASLAKADCPHIKWGRLIHSRPPDNETNEVAAERYLERIETVEPAEPVKRKKRNSKLPTVT
ncbi:hypothetical protein P3C61_07610 [Pseudomonas aeruginosa]|uniref:hypothetical protein n=1 Tax=Pseudomonas aeruginosa TaxID=287 RepID=UPI001C94E340|nr:hypothetical protein [Pseudomonas aeruginosa]